ncbi:MAG TPA: hypothetical protein VGM30_04605 [Puia sp.]|jgi:hypothetical protein
MKRKILGLAAVTLALCLSAFTLLKPMPSGVASYYWFPLNSASGFPQTVPSLVYQTFDPAFCGNYLLQPYCSAAFTSYSGTSAPYAAAGMEVIIDHVPDDF